MPEQTYDAIVIGAGLGGLLSAAQLLQRNKRVLLLERLPHSGGRFTAKTFQGAQISTGAVHLVPFGSSGVLAQMLRRLHIPHRLYDSDVFGSFYVHGKQYRARGVPGVYKFLGPRQFLQLLRLGYTMFFRPLPIETQGLPFDLWLERQIDVTRSPELVAFFRAVARFALSVELHQVSIAEVTRITKNMFRFGPPGIVAGGCGALAAELERHILAQGAELRLRSDVLQILHQDGQVTGVRVRDKATAEESLYTAPMVISDIGPRATSALLHNQQITQAQVLKESDLTNESFDEAIGLKVHFLSDISLIPHKGIMYCLDTQRIAGIVQPTNSDPRLAPPGKHLLISHQVIQSSDIEAEKTLALADLRNIFGENFEKHCHILTMSAYRGEWPVNRIAQGEDVNPQTEIAGLYMVGDAVKPSGYLMVEGVAQSVNRFLDLYEYASAPQPVKNGQKRAGAPLKQVSNVTPPPSRLNALRWLWEAPGNS